MPRYAVVNSNGEIIRTVKCGAEIAEAQVASDGMVVLEIDESVNDDTHCVDHPGESSMKIRQKTAQEVAAASKRKRPPDV